MRTWRFPMLLLVPALLVGGVLVQDRRAAREQVATRLDGAVPTVAASDAPSSTWYCAGGTATTSADAFAEQSIIVANAGSDDATGFVTAYSDTGTQGSRTITVRAHSTTMIRTSEVLKAPWAGVVVEVTGGGIAVTQELRGTAGRAVEACVSSPAAAWWFPSGTSRAGARLLLALFNPFPGEATVDLSFDTEDGARTPQQFQGLVVGGGRVTIVDVSAVVTLRDRVSTAVSVRSGRIVASQLQSLDGRNASAAGLSIVTGATITAPVWTFPVATPASVTAKELVTVTNPGSTDVDVQVQVQLDDPASNGTVEPFVAVVPARRTVVIDLGADPRIPPGSGRWLIVRSTGGEPIVASRTIGVPRSATAGGLASTIGVPIVSTWWVGTQPVPTEATPALLAVANPSATARATVTLTVHTGGRSREVSTSSSVAVGPGQRLVLDLQKLFGTRPDGPFEVTSDIGVVVGQWFTFSAPLDVSTIGAFPVAGTLSFPVDVRTADTVEFVDITTRTEDTVPSSSTSTTTTMATSTTTVAN